MNNAFFQSLGLAMRAGKIVSGEERVLLGIRSKQVYLTILSEDAAPNTRKRIQDKVTTYEVPLLYVSSRDLLGRAIGKEQRVVVGVMDAGFAERLITRYHT